MTHTIDHIVSVKKVRDFMLGDLEKTLSLTNTSARAPNFLLAFALCCYTEYWGQFLIGKKNRFHGYNRKCFNEFFKRLGPKYEFLIRYNHNNYDHIKCDHNIYNDIGVILILTIQLWGILGFVLYIIFGIMALREKPTLTILMSKIFIRFQYY